MEDLVKDVDAQIEEYRRQLRVQGELAESDLDELEDHLRELTNELVTAGKPAAEAVIEAARRLGDPRPLAREHARVRSQFGVPLSAGRAWSGAVLFVFPLALFFGQHYGEFELSLSAWFESMGAWLATGAIVAITIALAARMTWARAVVLGVTLHCLTIRLLMPWPLYPHMWIVDLAVLAFVMPWRRNESSPAAIKLALQAWACHSALAALALAASRHDEDVRSLGCVLGTVALLGAAAACIGTVRRARWSTIATVVSTLALFSALHTLSMWPFTVGDSLQIQLGAFAQLGSGAIAGTIAAFLGWRTTRSLVEPLRRSMP